MSAGFAMTNDRFCHCLILCRRETADLDVRVPSREFNDFATVLHYLTNLLLARFASLIMWEQLPEQNWFIAQLQEVVNMRKILSSFFLLLTPFIFTNAQQRELEVKNTAQRELQIIDTEERRVALVIGNGAYTDAPLLNPAKDAKDITNALRGLGFEVIHKENVTQNDLKKAIREFGQKIRKGGVGLFYYAGHGVQVEGSNYLIPIGATISHEAEIEYESVDVGFVLAQMEAAENRLNIVILDACRNNPFARAFRSAKNGLASLDAPSGTIIAYATGPGKVASDGDGGNGLYTLELLNVMQKADMKIEEVFKSVRIAVQKRSSGRQTPWESSSLVGDFYFLRKPTVAEATFPPPIIKEEKTTASTVALPAKTADTQPGKPENESAAKSRELALLIEKGDHFTNQRQWSEAEKEYRKALQVEPRNADCYGKIGYTFIQRSKWDKAAMELQKSLDIDPRNATRQSNLGWALQNMKKPEAAEQAYRQAIALAANQAVFHGNLGSFLFAQGRFAEAEKAFAEAVRLDPQSAMYQEQWASSRDLGAPNPEVDARPVAQNRLQPHYTPVAHSRGIEGAVKVRALVGEDGVVRRVRVVSGLGYGLDEEARRAVFQMKFKPATKDGKPVPYWVPLDVQFRTERHPPGRPPMGRRP
jgi:TonB family protein